MKPRISIAGLLGVVAFCGLAWASLRYASRLVAGAVYTVTGVVLVVAAYRAVRGKRPFWLGFALSGWAHLALSLWAMGESPEMITNTIAHIVRCLLSEGLAEVREYLIEELVVGLRVPKFQVSMSLMSLVIAFVGGLIASWSDRERRKTP